MRKTPRSDFTNTVHQPVRLGRHSHARMQHQRLATGVRAFARSRSRSHNIRKMWVTYACLATPRHAMCKVRCAALRVCSINHTSLAIMVGHWSRNVKSATPCIVCTGQTHSVGTRRPSQTHIIRVCVLPAREPKRTQLCWQMRV